MDRRETLYVSLSGGPDSLALLFWTMESERPFTAVHFEHGLRGRESLADAAFCRRFCKKHAVRFRQISLFVPRNRRKGEGDEAAARRLRLEAWKKITRDDKFPVVLLGHHADDAVETMLLRLFRGSNASGLAAIRHERTVEKIVFRRPLLDWTREDVLAYLKLKGVRRFRLDRTNAENDFLRNYIRNEWLPLLEKKAPFARAGLKRAFQALSDDALQLETSAADAWENCKDGNTAAWKVLSPALLHRVLRFFLSGKLGHDFIPDRELAVRLRKALAGESRTPCRIPLEGEEAFLTLRRGKILLEKKDTAPAAEVPADALWHWRTAGRIRFGKWALVRKIVKKEKSGFVFQPGGLYFDAALLPDLLTVTSPRPGDVIAGFDGRDRRLKKLFNTCHVPVPERSVYPVLRTPEGDVIGVPGLCASRFAEITPASEKIIVVSGAVFLP